MKKLKPTFYNRAFTLIELLVVISIIGLLASVTMAAINPARAKARDAHRIADFRSMTTALELYYNKYGVYPCGSVGLINPTMYDDDWDHDGSPAGDHFLNSFYVSGDACIGSPASGLVTENLIQGGIKDPGGSFYVYDVLDTRQSYILYTKLESSSNAAKMSGDGGLCNYFYEVGPGVGTMNSNFVCTP